MQSKTNFMYSIFHIEGGLGKHVAATAVAECIKNNHSDRQLIVVCAYPELFISLPFVDRVYRHGVTPYFYQDYIEDKDTLIFKHEPYFTNDHIHKRLPLVKSWCKLYDLTYNEEQPSLQFNARQYQIALNKWSRSKPILLLQTNGGALDGQPYPYSWARDMPYPLAKEVAEHFSKDYHVIQVTRNQETAIDGVEVVNNQMPNMELFGLLLVSQKQLLIDSSLQHAAAALNKPSTVLWVGTSPKIFGYDIHKNIEATLPEDVKLPDSYLFDYNFQGAAHECPLTDLNIFDTEEIINSLSH